MSNTAYEMTVQEGIRKVLVTGGGGFLGSAICRRLVARGDTVYSFCRRSYPELEVLGVHQIQGDISDRDAVDNAVKDKNIVFHTAAKAGVWGKYEDYHRINVVGTRNVVSTCRRHQTSILVHTSSPSVVFDGSDMEGADESAPYPDHYQTHYPKTKAMAERLVLKACQDGLNAVILRPHLIWGPGDNHLVPRIIARSEKLVRVGRADKRVDTIYIDNAADAHVLAANALEANPGLSGKIYFISQDEPVILWDMVDGILNAAGLPPVQRSLPYGLVRLIGAIFEGLYGIFGLPGEPPMTRFVANELATAHWFDISAAKKDLGYQPKVSTADGLDRLRTSLQHQCRR